MVLYNIIMIHTHPHTRIALHHIYPPRRHALPPVIRSHTDVYYTYTDLIYSPAKICRSWKWNGTNRREPP